MRSESVKKMMLFIGKLHGGGAERVFVEYANGLVQAGVEVHLVCLTGGAYESGLLSEVWVHKLGTRMRSALLPLLCLVRKIQPDVLLSGLTGANLVASVVGRIAGVAEIWVSVHNDLRVEGAIRNSSLASMEALAVKLSCKLATQVIAVSEGVADYVQASGYAHNSSITVVYNPIYHGGIAAMAEAEMSDVIKELIAPDKKYLVAAGRLEHQKGFDLLIEAYRRSGLQQKDVHLLILGEGKERATLLEQISESGLSSTVHLPGFVNNPYAVFRRAQAFVSSSRWEGFGNVLVEAMACGTPVITFDCPSGPAEVVGTTNGCVVVPPGDISALSNALIDDVVFDSVRISANVLKTRAQKFSTEAAAEKLLRLLNAN